MWFKVCGITADAEVRMPAGQGVDAVGLGYGVPTGPYDHHGIDADSGVRDAAGHLSPALVGAFHRAWDTARHDVLQEEQHALPG